MTNDIARKHLLHAAATMRAAGFAAEMAVEETGDDLDLEVAIRVIDHLSRGTTKANALVGEAVGVILSVHKAGKEGDDRK